MKVKRLKQILSKYDDNADVIVVFYNCKMTTVEDIKSVGDNNGALQLNTESFHKYTKLFDPTLLNQDKSCASEL